MSLRRRVPPPTEARAQSLLCPADPPRPPLDPRESHFEASGSFLSISGGPPPPPPTGADVTTGAAVFVTGAKVGAPVTMGAKAGATLGGNAGATLGGNAGATFGGMDSSSEGGSGGKVGVSGEGAGPPGPDVVPVTAFIKKR